MRQLGLLATFYESFPIILLFECQLQSTMHRVETGLFPSVSVNNWFNPKSVSLLGSN